MKNGAQIFGASHAAVNAGAQLDEVGAAQRQCHDDGMTNPVTYWWFSLCAIATGNVCAWTVTAIMLRRERATLSTRVYAARGCQLIFSGIYVAGCAYRSVYPVYDVPRICLFDTWASSVLLGRSVAMIAELCFVAQWALLLHRTARATGSGFGMAAARVVVPLIAIAETCSWYSVLTTSNFGHTLEETIWGGAAALMVLCVLLLWSRSAPARRPVLAALCIAGSAYVAFMFLVDVPMYWSRWVADEAAGRHYMSILQGLHDVAVRRVISYHWSDWQKEVVWMTLYFSVAVWISIALIHAPVPEAQTALGRRRRFHAAPQPTQP